ncbi:MAG: sugar ABC transporter permease, partial [Clostridiales bacterium]|nr:sugar ABC transporter permease [Clostridiales bacterium]
MLMNNYIPMSGIVIAFKKIDFRLGVWGSPWVGLDNFRFLFASKDAFTITRNTVLYNFAFFAFGTFFAIAFAILMNELRSRFAKKFYQTAILLPFLMSWVVVSYLAFAFLSAETGLINSAIRRPLGLGGISWYQQKQYWPFIIIFVSLWK